jgi:hypothetical protein
MTIEPKSGKPNSRNARGRALRLDSQRSSCAKAAPQGESQTTNLGVRSSNLFGRAITIEDDPNLPPTVHRSGPTTSLS